MTVCPIDKTYSVVIWILASLSSEKLCPIRFSASVAHLHWIV